MDQDVLNDLWEVTKRRLDEEEDRRKAAIERSSKIMTFDFTLVAGIGVAIGLSKELIRESTQNFGGSLAVVTGLLGLSLFLLIFFTLRSLFQSFAVGRIGEYHTWPEADLSKVELGGKDFELGYRRMIIKSAWTFLTHNIRSNDLKYEKLHSSIVSFERAACCFVSVAVMSLLSNACLGWNSKLDLKEKNNLKTEEVMSNPTPKTPPVPSKPTPPPSTGTPIKKSETPPPPRKPPQTPTR